MLSRSKPDFLVYFIDMQRVMHWIKTSSKIQRVGALLLALIILSFIIPRIRGVQSGVTYRVSKGEISESIVISGNANATDNAKVFSPTTGLVEEVYVANGDEVTVGQELMKVQSTAMEADRAAMYAAYQSTVAGANTSKQAKITNQSLLESARKTVIDTSIAKQQMEQRRIKGSPNPATSEQYTQDEIDSIISAYESAKTAFTASEKKFLDADTSIAAAQSAVSAAWLEYQATLNGVIKAPVAGKVANLAVDSGDYVRAKISSPTTTNDGEPILRILAGRAVTVAVKLNEIDITKVRVGQKATVRFDALPETLFSGSVVRVDTVGENDNAVVTYNTYVVLENSDERIRPTMTATVTIETDFIRDILVVPNSALTRTDDGKTAVVRMQGNREVVTPVTTGKKSSTVTHIVNGLSDGDMILIPKEQ